MMLIEPCCAPKHVGQLMGQLEEGCTMLFHGYGDLSMAELLPALLVRYSGTEMILATPSLPDNTAEAVAKIMRMKHARMDGSGNVAVIRHLTLLTNLSERRSPMASAWVRNNPFGERMTLKHVQQNDTAILMPDVALIGPINLTYGGRFTALATRDARTIAALRSEYEKMV